MRGEDQFFSIKKTIDPRRSVLLISEVKAGFGANHVRINLRFGRRRKS